MQTCKECLKTKPSSKEHFELRKDKGIYRFRLVCRECMSIKKRAYTKLNSDIIRIRRATHYQQNKEAKHQYYLDNKDSILSGKRKRDNERRSEDPSFRVRKNVSRLVSLYLQKHGHPKKGVSFFQATGYTPDQLKKHLESLWEPWMTWSNYGSYQKNGPRTWNIDHIIPQSLLPYDCVSHPNFLVCWSLDNLRPLDSKENMSKSNKII